MFETPRYVTRGVENTIPGWLVHLMWGMIDGMEVEHKDALQIFMLTKFGDNQQIRHTQEQPPYSYQLDSPCSDAINTKVYVIDNGLYSTMLLAEEY